MTSQGVLQILFYFAVLLALTVPLGSYMALVYEGRRTFLHPILRPLERLLYALGGVREEASSAGLSMQPLFWPSASSVLFSRMRFSVCRESCR